MSMPSPMSVSIGPGYTPITSVFFRSRRCACVNECAAAFEAEYVAQIGKLTNDAIELTLINAVGLTSGSTDETLANVFEKDLAIASGQSN